jgi:monoamine oxidase
VSPGQTRADVLVLGAGVSGLAAAAKIVQGDCSIRILEARDRIGGRIFTLRRPGWPVPIDLGAEFIQGPIPALLSIADAAQQPVIELGGARWQAHAGELLRADDFLERTEELLATVFARAKDRDVS